MANVSIVNNSDVTISKIVLWHSSSLPYGFDPELQGQRVIEAKNFGPRNHLYGTAILERFTLDYWIMALMVKDYEEAYLMTGSSSTGPPPFPWKEFEMSMNTGMDFRFDSNPTFGSKIWIDYNGTTNADSAPCVSEKDALISGALNGTEPFTIALTKFIKDF